MKKRFKILSLFMSAVLIISIFGIPVYAADGGPISEINATFSAYVEMDNLIDDNGIQVTTSLEDTSFDTGGPSNYTTYRYTDSSFSNVEVYAAAAYSGDSVFYFEQRIYCSSTPYYIDENTKVIVDGVEWEVIENGKAGYDTYLIVRSPEFSTYSSNWEVTFNVNGAEIAPPDHAFPKYYAHIKKPTIESWTGHSLIGWFTEAEGGTQFDFANTRITGNIELYAHWKTKTGDFTVSFDANVKNALVSDPSLIIPSQEITKGKQPKEPKISRNDFELLGWYRHPSGDALEDRFDFANDVVSSDLTLYAYWAQTLTLCSYDLTNNKLNQGGSVTLNGAAGYTVSSTDIETASGTVDTISAKAANGYKFIEWRLISSKESATEYNAKNAPYFSSDDECIFERISGAYTIYAVFEKVGKHNIVKVPYKDATCTKNGNNEYYYCKDCRKYFKDSAGKTETTAAKETIYATGSHYYEFNKITKAPDFKSAGSELYVCAVCGSKTTLPVDKLSYPAKVSAKAIKKGFKASWVTCEGVEGYQIQYSLKKNMKKSTKLLIESDVVNNWTVKKLKKNKRYFVRVRAYTLKNGKKVFSPWSAVKKVKAK